MEMLKKKKKNDQAARWGIMSIPLMEIKLDIIDPTFLRAAF